MRLGLAVESMKRHTTDEGWQIFAGLEHAGYSLAGHQLPIAETDVGKLLWRYDPDVVVIQDKREWDVSPRDFRDARARFENAGALKNHRSFKLTIVKDTHQKPEYHAQALEEMGIDATIIYYEEAVVRRLAPYLGAVIRTYHTIDKDRVPPFARRHGVGVLTGAISSAYPLRERLTHRPPIGVACVPHPGYGLRGCYTNQYLKLLSQYRVAICTASKYHYALRKIMEATACGCVVVTNLPASERLPGIDGNLVRIADDTSNEEVGRLVQKLALEWRSEKQEFYAVEAKQSYDYRVVGSKLAEDIEHARAGAERRV